MGRRILNDALRSIVNAESTGKATPELQPISTVMSSFLKIMKDRGTFAMKESMLPLLEKAAPDARVITISSGGMYTAPLTKDLDILNYALHLEP